MIHQIAKGLTARMINRKIIEASMAEVYQYGLELILSTTLTTFSIIGIACLVDTFQYGLLYFSISIPLRVTVGGYHASTYTRCFVISNLAYFAVSVSARCLTAFAMPLSFWMILLFGSTCYILANSPVRNPHHPVSNKVLRKNKYRSILILCIDCSLIISLYIKQQQSALLNLAVITILSVALFILPTKRKGGVNDGAEYSADSAC